MHTFLVLENCGGGGGEKYVLGSWIRVMAGSKGCLESKGDRTNKIINSFYFFTDLIHLVFFTILAYLSLHVSDQSVHQQEDQMLNYTSSFWRRSLGR